MPDRRDERVERDTGDRDELVTQAEELGQMHYAAENFSVAADYWLKALEEESDDPGRRFRLLLGLSDCHRRKGERADARRYLDMARSAMPERASVRDHASLEFREGHLMLAEGHYQSALKEAEGAYRRLRPLDEHGFVGYVKTLIGHCCLRLGRLVEAEEHFADSLAAFRRAEDEVGAAYALNNIGLLHKNACRWTVAVEYFERALEIAKKREMAQQQLLTTKNLGIAYGKMRRFPDAIAAFTGVANRAEDFGDHLLLGRALLMLGRTYVQAGYLSEASKTLHRARAKALQLGYARECALADEYIGEMHIAQGDYARALESLEAAVKRARTDAPAGDVVAECVRRIADAQYALGEVDAALASINEGLPLAEKSGEFYELGYLHYCRGRCLLRTGEEAAAVEALKTAVATFDRYGNPYQRALCQQQLARYYMRSETPVGALKARELLREAAATLAEEGDEPAAVYATLLRAVVERRNGRLNEALRLAVDAQRRAEKAHDTRSRRASLRIRRRIEGLVSTSAGEVLEKIAGLADVAREKPGVIEERIGAALDLIVSKVGAGAGFVALVRGKGSPDVVARSAIASRSAKELLGVVEDISHGDDSTALSMVDLSADQLPNLNGDAPRCSMIVHRLRGPRLSGYVCLLHANGGAAPLAQDAMHLLAAFAGIVSIALSEPRHIHASLEEERVRHEEDDVFAGVVTENLEMKRLFKLAAQVAPSNATVLLQGETGTGKGLIAQAVHRLSGRSDREFVHVNCAAMPEALLESELFGHVRGAFTGAVSDKDGLLHRANGGTIFLDEIGKTSLQMQGKLLQFLDTSQVRRVGSNEYTKVDVRVICASKNDLLELARLGRFLEDLYYRLSDFPLTIPPLRDRPEDIGPLVRHYLQLITAEMKKPITGVEPECMQVLRTHTWPGNVRELGKVIKRAVILAEYDKPLGANHLPRELTAEREARESDPCEGQTLKQYLEHVERREIRKSLDRHGWNKSQTAVHLGMSYQNLLYKIKRYKIS